MSDYFDHPFFMLAEQSTHQRNEISPRSVENLLGLLDRLRMLVKRRVTGRDYDGMLPQPREFFIEERKCWTLDKLFATRAMKEFWLPDSAHLDPLVLKKVATTEIPIPCAVRFIVDHCAQERLRDATVIPPHNCTNHPWSTSNHRQVVSKSLSMLGLHARQCLSNAASLRNVPTDLTERFTEVMIIVDQVDFCPSHKRYLVEARDVLLCIAYHKEVLRRREVQNPSAGLGRSIAASVGVQTRAAVKKALDKPKPAVLRRWGPPSKSHARMSTGGRAPTHRALNVGK